MKKYMKALCLTLVLSMMLGTSGCALLARNINSQLERIGYRNIGISERPNLIVLNSTSMPAVLVEAGFINSGKQKGTGK